MAKRDRLWPEWGAQQESLIGQIRQVLRTIYEVVPGGVLRAGKRVFGEGTGWLLGTDSEGRGQVDIGSSSRYFRFDGERLTWATENTNLAADGSLTAVNAFFSGVLDSSVLDLELMKLSFASISWAQFAVFESFSDESARADPDPSSPEAEVGRGRLWNGGDETPGKAFGFRSKTYESITTVLEGTATDSGPGYLEDSAGTWFEDQYRGYELVVGGTVKTLTGCSVAPYRLLFEGSYTPPVEPYEVRAALPGYVVGFMSFRDSSNGGYGSVRLQVSFDGSHWLTLYETGVVDRLGGIVEIEHPGRDYRFQVWITNDGEGRGAEVYRVLFCTDPSVWG